MTTGKTIALTRWASVVKVMSLLFNTLKSLSAVILEPKKIKPLTVSIVSPSICHEVMEPDAISFIFWNVDMSQDIEKILYKT